jgi:hypothetical protein
VISRRQEIKEKNALAQVTDGMNATDEETACYRVKGAKKDLDIQFHFSVTPVQSDL